MHLFILYKLYINKTYLKRNKRTEKNINVIIHRLYYYKHIQSLHKFRDELLELIREFTKVTVCKINYISIHQIKNEIFLKDIIYESIKYAK